MATRRKNRVAIIGGARTPFARVASALRHHSALDLSVHAVNAALSRTGIEPERVDILNHGIVVLHPRVPHMAREVALQSRLGTATRALTLTDNCITGISAIASAVHDLYEGRGGLAIAGGVESMSNPPILFSRAATRLMVDFGYARDWPSRLRLLAGLRPWHLKPQPPGIAEPSTGLSMGQHCELMVKEWDISRGEQDALALESHKRASTAMRDGRLAEEIAALADLDHDNLVRSDSSLTRLARLPPVFDRSEAGTITAASSSPLTDGAAALVLAHEKHTGDNALEPLAWIRDFEFAAIDPAEGLLMAPALAVPRLLARNRIRLDQIDLVEVHEAFAGQVACNLKAWAQGWQEAAIGSVDPARLNTRGSSIAIGHPFAATGIRIALSLALEMRRCNARYGLVSICGAGATAAALLLERD